MISMDIAEHFKTKVRPDHSAAIRWLLRSEVEFDQRQYLLSLEFVYEVVPNGIEDFRSADQTIVIVVIRNTQRQLDSFCIVVTVGILRHSSGDVDSHRANGIRCHIKGKDGVAVAALEVACGAIDHADVLYCEAED